jgi:hypothetical protein
MLKRKTNDRLHAVMNRNSLGMTNNITEKRLKRGGDWNAAVYTQKEE